MYVRRVIKKHVTFRVILKFTYLPRYYYQPAVHHVFQSYRSVLNYCLINKGCFSILLNSLVTVPAFCPVFLYFDWAVVVNWSLYVFWDESIATPGFYHFGVYNSSCNYIVFGLILSLSRYSIAVWDVNKYVDRERK